MFLNTAVRYYTLKLFTDSVSIILDLCMRSLTIYYKICDDATAILILQSLSMTTGGK